MKALLLILFGVVTAYSQPVTAGLKAGVPLTDFFDTVQNASTSIPNRYIVGGTVELRLPMGLGVEFDALYRHVNYTLVTTTSTNRTTASSWEFPLLLKYRFHAPIARPYVDAGIAWNTLSGISSSITSAVATTLPSSAPVAHNTTKGFVIGAGVDIHAIVLHISPELRYTRWTDKQLNLNGVLNSNQNQAEFLVGFTF